MPRRLSKQRDSPREEITQVHKFAVVRVFHIDNTPAVSTSTYCLAIKDHVVLRAHNSERDGLLPNKELLNEQEY